MRSLKGQMIPKALRKEAEDIQKDLSNCGVFISLQDAYSMICDNFRSNGRDKISFLANFAKKRGKG